MKPGGGTGGVGEKSEDMHGRIVGIMADGLISQMASGGSEYRSANRYSAETLVERCPNCLRDTKVRRIDQRLIWPHLTENLAPPLTAYAVEEVWTCLRCDRVFVNLKVFEDGSEQSREPIKEVVVYPIAPPRTLPDIAPLSVRSLFEEASVAETAGALRGAAGLLRATVETLLNERGFTQGPLFDKIEKLRDQGVDGDIVDDLHEARFLGNDSLHDGVTFAPEEVGDVAALISDAIDQLYVEPARRQAMRQARKDRRAKGSLDSKTGSD